MDIWEIYGVVEPSPGGPSPACCLGQVWFNSTTQEESLVEAIVTHNGVRVAYVFNVALGPEQWPPAGAVLVAGPHAPWRP